MSDHEFENYLTLIGRLLRLSSSQREAIGEELRDHFESRLAELVESGLSHHEAVRLALEEFGDAAGLAAQFSEVSQTRKRRLVMRCTVGSVAALAAAIVIAMASWPEQQAGLVMERAGAQTAEKQKEEKIAKPAMDEATAKTEAKLKEYTNVEFMETPLSDFLAYVRDSAGVQVYVDRKTLSDAGVDPTGAKISINLPHVRWKMLLELALNQFDCGYMNRDGIVIVSTKEQIDSELVTRVYDCREILMADMLVAARSLEPMANKQKGGFGGGGFGGPAGVDDKPAQSKLQTHAPRTDTEAAGKLQTPAERLVDVICTTIAPNTWDEVGGPATISEFNGLLVVSQTSAVQSQVAELLEQLSEKLASRSAK
jgi:hypothetical protein